MKSKLGFLFSLLLLVLSCKPGAPSGILSSDEMEDILYDYHLADATAQENSAEQDYNIKLYRAGVLKKHNTDQAQFDSSMVYYLRHTEELKGIYERLADRLNDEVVSLGGSSRNSDSFNLSANGDTTDVWNGDQTIVLNQHEPFNLYTFSIPVDSSYHKGDELILNAKSEFIFQDGMRDGIAVFVAKYNNDSIATQSIHISSSAIQSLGFTDRDHIGYKEIKGYFMLNKGMDPSGQSSTTLRLMILHNIKIIRMHEATLDPMKAKQDSLNAVNDSMNASQGGNPSSVQPAINGNEIPNTENRPLPPNSERQMPPNMGRPMKMDEPVDRQLAR